MKTVGNRTCSTSCHQLLLLSDQSASACAASTCTPTVILVNKELTRLITQMCTNYKLLAAAGESGSQVLPEVVLGKVGADLTAESRRFDTKRLRFPQTEIALERPVIKLLHAHHHPGRGGGRG